MILKLLASALVIAGCGSVGFSMCNNYQKELDSLEDLIRCLEWMILELNFRMPPLGQLCMDASQEAKGKVQSVLNRFAKEMDEKISPNLAQCMAVAIAETQDIPEMLCKHLKDLGSSVGVFDIEGQVVALQAVLERCKQDYLFLSNEKEHRLRNYKTFGICAGVALVIILL